MIQIDEIEKLVIDTDKNLRFPLGSPEAFKILSNIWLKSGWEAKYVYSFSWLGRPIIQLPEDMIRIQEVIFDVKPDIIVETGIAHGGSLIFYASLLKALGKGKVIGIDIEIRPHNKKAIEQHFLFNDYIEIIEGDSTSDAIVDDIRSRVKDSKKVMVILDSNHTKEHVLKELVAYSKLITVNSYIIATDGIMELVEGLERTSPDWSWNNPKAAAIQFQKENKNFVIVEPEFQFNESSINDRVTYWPSCYLKRIH
jgi:cephalosporin hydroxylase